jgi:hypothetical protein
MDPQLIWIAIAVAAVLIVALIASASIRRRRTHQLRDKFGPEYGHAVRATGSRTRAEKDLVAREARVSELTIRSLNASERERFVAEWQKVEARFVQRPATAVVEADEMIDEVMRTRGYPVSDFEHRAADLSVHHPRIVENYRAAHKIIDDRSKTPTTEELRQAMIRLRNLFDELVRSGDTETSIQSERELAPADERPVDRLSRTESSEPVIDSRDDDRGHRI